MALHDEVARLRAKRIEEKGNATPDEFQGVTKDKIRSVLGYLDLGENADLVDGVFALLDDETESWFAKPPDGARFCDGATTAHLACHVGILQRGGGKLNREGRDYWIKPLRELGGIEPITLQKGEFIVGHVKAKSPNSSYRLNEDLRAILQASDDHPRPAPRLPPHPPLWPLRQWRARPQHRPCPRAALRPNTTARVRSCRRCR